MTRFKLAIFSLLPLAVMVGCGDPTNCTGDECDGGNSDCVGASCADTGSGPDGFKATLRSKAPNEWVGDHVVRTVDDEDVNECMDVNECDSNVDIYGNFRVSLSGDTWDCVSQVILVGEPDYGSTVSISDAWLGEGMCSKIPDGVYSGYDVRTDIKSFINGFDQMTISIESWDAVITANSFIYDREYYFEGTVSDDLTTIEYFAISGSGNESGGTIILED